MSGTHRFVLQKHLTEKPHFDLKLECGDLMKWWILPNRIPDRVSVKTLAIEMTERVFNSERFSGEMADPYGTGEVRVCDSGYYKILGKSAQKIAFRARGNLLKGRFVLLVPSWGRWTAKRLWIIIKINDR